MDSLYIKNRKRKGIINKLKRPETAFPFCFDCFAVELEEILKRPFHLKHPPCGRGKRRRRREEKRREEKRREEKRREEKRREEKSLKKRKKKKKKRKKGKDKRRKRKNKLLCELVW